MIAPAVPTARPGSALPLSAQAPLRPTRPLLPGRCWEMELHPSNQPMVNACHDCREAAEPPAPFGCCANTRVRREGAANSSRGGCVPPVQQLHGSGSGHLVGKWVVFDRTGGRWLREMDSWFAWLLIDCPRSERSCSRAALPRIQEPLCFSFLRVAHPQKACDPETHRATVIAHE